MKTINFGCFTISTYMAIIGISFLTSLVPFYKISKKNYDKLDIIYVYALNIIGFALGSKLLWTISNGKISLYDFINSGYSFSGGIIGSVLVVAIYCKKYKFSFTDLLSRFAIIYPLIYSISKTGCFLNGCCFVMINNNKVPLPLIDSVIMLLFFIILLNSKKEKTFIICAFFSGFGIIRFLEDFFRESRNIFVLNLTPDQIICLAFIISSLLLKLICKKENRATAK